MRRMAEEQARKVSDFSRQNVTKILSNALGVDVFLAEPYLKAESDAFVKQNVDLITTVARGYFDKVEQAVMGALQRGTRVEDLRDQIEARFEPEQNHAMLIARDQVGKFNGQLNMLRQTELGISRYKWDTSHDERVRGNPAGIYPNAEPSHWANELQDNGWGPGIWSWDDPPESGHPGEDYQCRCVAIPVVDVDELAGEGAESS